MALLICIIGSIISVFLFIYEVKFRLTVLHPIKTITYVCKDTYKYFKYHKYDWLEPGELLGYIAHFGGGKTLSLVVFLYLVFRRYNNKYVYDERKKKWLLQKVHILTNVKLNGVPCEPLTSLAQMVDYGERNKRLDEKMGTRTVTLVSLDEASSQLNSREFKNNFSWDTLNSILTSRHLLISMYYTAQKFKHVDALLRSVTQRAVLCKKEWRYMTQLYFDADALELATDTSLLQPLRRTGFFIEDKHFDLYDTNALVEKLNKDARSGKVLTDEEILTLRGQLNPDNDAIINPSFKLRRMRKRQ